MGIFGNLFDFNNDGKLDTLEKATEFTFFMSMINAIENEDDDDFEQNDEEW